MIRLFAFAAALSFVVTAPALAQAPGSNDATYCYASPPVAGRTPAYAVEDAERMRTVRTAVAHCRVGEVMYFSMLQGLAPTYTPSLLAAMMCDLSKNVIAQNDSVACIFAGIRTVRREPRR